MTQYLGLTNDNRVDHVAGRLDPPGMVGPIAPPPADTDQYTYVRWDEPVRLTANAPTEIHRWVDGAPVWIETASMEIVAARAIDTMDAEGDAARLKVIGDPTKVLEYQLAEAQARPYAAASYPDPAPECVASWAEAKRWANGGEPWTGQQAADDIITTADRWYGALERIRRLRLDAKERVRAVVAAGAMLADVDAIAAQFSTDLSNLMKGIE
jgi:hypothetical protein